MLPRLAQTPRAPHISVHIRGFEAKLPRTTVLRCATVLASSKFTMADSSETTSKHYKVAFVGISTFVWGSQGFKIVQRHFGAVRVRVRVRLSLVS